MGILSTALLMVPLGANADDKTPTRHPVIGHINAREFLNSDLLALPDRERDAWLHGAVVLMVQTSASQSGNAARCVMDWYFELPETQGVILTTMGRFPDSQASATLFGLADRSCEELMD